MDTTLNVETNILDSEFRISPILKGAPIFLNTYNEIQEQRSRSSSPIPKWYLDCRNEDQNELSMFFSNPESYSFAIPRWGICSEVLFYYSLKDIIDVSASTISEDCRDHIDFYVMDFPVDITCSRQNYSFRNKWSLGRCPTLFIPVTIDEPVLEKDLPPFDIENSYASRLLYEGSFNKGNFLSHILSINWNILHIMRKHHWQNSEIEPLFNGQTRFRYGDISQVLLNNQSIFLTELTKAITGQEVEEYRRIKKRQSRR